MVNAGQGFGLLREFPDQPPVPSGVFEQKFNYYRHPVQSLVARQKHHADPAAPELALDQVPPLSLPPGAGDREDDWLWSPDMSSLRIIRAARLMDSGHA